MVVQANDASLRLPLDDLRQTITGVARLCPVCAGSAGNRVHFNRMAVCAGYDFSAPIVLCASCGCGHTGTALGSEDLNAYYSGLSKYDELASADDVSAHDRERASLAVAFITPLVTSVGSAFDVGCAAGVFLKALQDAGIKHVEGIDPAAGAAAVAKKLFGIRVTRAEAASFNDYGSFDLVCLMAVLEHLLEPRQLLLRISQQLKPGARILIEVPDAGAFDRPGCEDLYEPFGEFSNEHINFFAIGDIRKLAHDVGLEVERWQAFRTAGGSPGIFALLHRASRTAKLVSPIASSSKTQESGAEAISRYVSRSVFFQESIEKDLARDTRGDILIYGAGNHTCRLMASSKALSRCTIRAVFDRNVHLHGHKIGDVTIVSPADLPRYPGIPIIVSTFNASLEIQAALRRMTTQPVVTLYHSS